MAYTGCRVSEALNLTTASIDFEAKAIVFETLKKRKTGVYRAVPVPDTLLDTLNMAHGILDGRRGKKKTPRLPIWTWCRKTAWVKVTTLMKAAKIGDGPTAVPKAYGIAMG